MDWRNQLRTAGLTVGAIVALMVVVSAVSAGVSKETPAPLSNLSAPLVAPQDASANVVDAPAKEPTDVKEPADVAQFNAARLAVNAIKDSMRDPDSLRVDSIHVSSDANTICVHFGARDGFGGMNREHVVYFNGAGSQSVSVWNRRCTKQQMADMTFAAP